MKSPHHPWVDTSFPYDKDALVEQWTRPMGFTKLTVSRFPGKPWQAETCGCLFEVADLVAQTAEEAMEQATELAWRYVDALQDGLSRGEPVPVDIVWSRSAAPVSVDPLMWMTSRGFEWTNAALRTAGDQILFRNCTRRDKLGYPMPMPLPEWMRFAHDGDLQPDGAVGEDGTSTSPANPSESAPGALERPRRSPKAFIRVTQLVDELSDADDAADKVAGPNGKGSFKDYLVDPALSKERALDRFHASVPIAMLEEFDIEYRRVEGE